MKPGYAFRRFFMEKPHKDHDALEIFNMAKNLSDQDKELFVDLLKNLLRKAA